MVDQISDHILNRFRLLAARKTLTRISTEEIVDLANETLTDGTYHSSLLAIIDSRPQTHKEVAPHFELFCKDNQIPIGDAAWALQYVQVYFITRMALANSDPNGELVSLMHAVGPETLDRLYKEKHTLGLDRIFSVGMQYNYFVQYHDVPPNELESARIACLRLVPELRIAANEWIKQCGKLRCIS